MMQDQHTVLPDFRELPFLSELLASPDRREALVGACETTCQRLERIRVEQPDAADDAAAALRAYEIALALLGEYERAGSAGSPIADDGSF